MGRFTPGNKTIIPLLHLCHHSFLRARCWRRKEPITQSSDHLNSSVCMCTQPWRRGTFRVDQAPRNATKAKICKGCTCLLQHNVHSQGERSNCELRVTGHLLSCCRKVKYNNSGRRERERARGCWAYLRGEMSTPNTNWPFGGETSALDLELEAEMENKHHQVVLRV